MAEFKHGSMDINAHEKTFESFIKVVVRGAIVCLGVLIFLAIFNS